MKTAIAILILFLQCNITYAVFSDTTIINTTDTLYVKYQFWSPPKYSIDNKIWRSANSFFSIGAYKSEFTAYFKKETEAYALMKLSEKKLIQGNCLFALPSGACIGMALFYLKPENQKKNLGYVLLTSGIVLAFGDIIMGRSSYKDLAKAVSRRNEELEKQSQEPAEMNNKTKTPSEFETCSALLKLSPSP